MLKFQYQVLFSGGRIHNDEAAVTTEADARQLVEYWNKQAQHMKLTYSYGFSRIIGKLTKDELERGSETYDGNIKRLVCYMPHKTTTTKQETEQ